jgi:hypothetical protein
MSSAAPRLTVRPILYTDHVDDYLTIFTALGMTTLLQSPGWTLVAGRAGRVAMHATMDGRVDEGTVHLGFETEDLTAYLDSITESIKPFKGLSAEVVKANQGPAVKVTTREGTSYFVDSRSPGAGPSDCPVVVEPLWITKEVAQATDDFEALGLRKVMTNLDGRVAYLHAHDGQMLTHIADWGWTGTLMALDCVGDIQSAHAALLHAGVAHNVIDETHGSTLRVPMPGTEEEMWISKLDEDPVGVVRH